MALGKDKEEEEEEVQIKSWRFVLCQCEAQDIAWENTERLATGECEDVERKKLSRRLKL